MTVSIRNYMAFLLTLALVASPAIGQEHCKDIFGAKTTQAAKTAAAQRPVGPTAAQRSAVPAATPTFETTLQKPGTPYHSDGKSFRLLADRIEQHRQKFTDILTAVDNFHGAKYEIDQAIKTLRGVPFHELDYLKDIDHIRNIAVYGSTNIPLYTLILHTIIPASTGAHIWFRTPQSSRDTYVKLMATLRQLIPEIDLSHIHILTDSNDVQYDNFRKQHVLGLNRKGSRYLRNPSEIVIFTGKPETGDEIISSLIRKIEEMKGKDPRPVKTAFLKFGSGLNPVIVTNYARQQLNEATNAAVEAIRINSSQDCIAPKFYAVHNSLAAHFQEIVQDKISRLKFGSTRDESSDYGPLTFKEDFQDMKAFREKWSEYLVNKDAVIDPATKRVDPHYFVFPFSKFKEVELVDHFAPFLVSFNYASDVQLEQIANDPRVRSRAMFATLFGDSSKTQMYQLRKMFEDNFHATILNQSIFVEESGNFPFGGYSRNASSSTLIQSSENGDVQVYNFNRPILFSREARTLFGTTRTEKPYAQLATSKGFPQSRQKLNQILKNAVQPDFVKELNDSWTYLSQPQFSERAHGLEAIREAIKTNGLKVAILKQEPLLPKDKQKDHFFYGPNLLYVNSYQDQPTPVKGVVLHPAGIGNEVYALNGYRGDINPHLGYGFLHEIFATNKTAEFWMADAIWPGSMPASLSYKQLLKRIGEKPLDPLRSRLVETIDAISMTPTPMTLTEKNQLVDDITALVDHFFSMTHQIFPQGAFIKNFDESTTGDLGNQITTFSQNSRNYALQFANHLEDFKKSTRKPFSEMGFVRFTKSVFHETGTKVIAKLLLDPDELLIQKRVRIAKTDLGFPMEIRVDFVDGTAINSRARYSHEYLGPERQEAEQVLNQFFEKAPTPLKMISGGADLVKLENGDWVFMEFNVGQSSGSINADTFPIETNVFLSRLQGKPTPLIRWLESAFAAGLTAQRKVLSDRKVEKEKWNKESIDDLSLAEVAKYMRDRYLDEWQKNPTAENAAFVLQQLQLLFDGQGSPTNRDLPLFLHGAENFLNQELMQRGLSLPTQADSAA